MNCPQLQKVSMLLDGELSPAEEARLRTHLKECQECKQAWQDFAALRRELLAATASASSNTQEVLERILHPSQAGFWKRRIAVPAPLAAAAALLLAALSIWIGTVQLQQRPATTAAPFPAPADRFDLARFDRGEPALIYTQPKPEGRPQ